jgi:hypothetical protein
MLKDLGHSIMKFDWSLYIGDPGQFAIILLGISILIGFDYFMDKLQFDEFLASKTMAFRWSFYLLFFFLIIFIGNINGKTFIYAKF